MKKISDALSIGQFASGLGVSVVIIRCWCWAGKISEAFRALVRFGHELILQVCRGAGTDVVVLDDEKEIPFEQELCQDALTLMTVISARLYGKRAHKKPKLCA